MQITIDIPDELLHRGKVVAAQRRTTLRNLVIEGQEKLLCEAELSAVREDALARLRKGFHLSGRLLTREEIHDRGAADRRACQVADTTVNIAL